MIDGLEYGFHRNISRVRAIALAAMPRTVGLRLPARRTLSKPAGLIRRQFFTDARLACRSSAMSDDAAYMPHDSTCNPQVYGIEGETADATRYHRDT